MMGKGIFALSAVVLAVALQAKSASANDYGYDKKPENKYPEYPAKKVKEYEPAYKQDKSYPYKDDYKPYPQPKKVEKYPETKYPAKPYEPEYKPGKKYEPYPEKKEYPSYPEQKKYDREYKSYPEKSYSSSYTAPYGGKDKYPERVVVKDKYLQPSYEQQKYQPNYQQDYEPEYESDEYLEEYKYEDPYECRTCERPKLKNKLVVIAVAGLRYDAYARNKDVMPTVTQFIYEGTESKHVFPSYPSEVVPCSRTLMTGVETQTHNLAGNFHVNVERYKNHSLSEYRIDDLYRTTSYPEDYTYPHIGILQEAKVAGLKVCSQGFLREDVRPYGIKLDYAVPWPGDSDNDVNTAQDNGAIGAHLVKGCDFTVIYINELLNRAEKYGPNSKQVRKFLRKLDNLLNKFLKDLECEGVNPKDVNIAIVGLNGVSDASHIYPVSLEKYVSYENVYRIHGYGAYMGFFTLPNRALVVYNRLKYVKGIKVYLRKDIPEEFKYMYSCNCPDVLVVPEDYYYILPLYNPKAIPSIDPYNFTVPKGYTGRFAGEYEEARSALVLVGPAFKKYHKIEAVRLVDLYNLFAYLLDVYPRKNEGKFSRIQDALVKYAPKNYNDYYYGDNYSPSYYQPKNYDYPAPSYKPGYNKEKEYKSAPAYNEKPYSSTYVKDEKYPAPSYKSAYTKEKEYKEVKKVDYPQKYDPKPAYPPKESYDYPKPSYEPKEKYPSKKASYPEYKA